jgi:hypothetical protein
MCKHGKGHDSVFYCALLFQEFQLTCPALGKRGLVTGGCGAGTVAVGAGGLLRIPGAETACA